MNTRFLIIVSFMLTVSCGQKLVERHYKSMDMATGGFNDFFLYLKSNGCLELLIISTKTVSITDSGNIVEGPTKTVTGKWTMKDEMINCTFDDPKSSIDNFFIETDFKDAFKDKQFLVFSSRLDTAFIYGLPCILLENK